MFHQVGPVGPFDKGTVRVTPSAELAPVGTGTGDWAVIDDGELVCHAPLQSFRVSVLWKADVYKTAAERTERLANRLSMQQVADIFNDDLAKRETPVRFDLARVDDVSLLKAELASVYPEATPVGALPSVLAYA
jgi:hypothetical protein